MIVINIFIAFVSVHIVLYSVMLYYNRVYSIVKATTVTPL